MPPAAAITSQDHAPELHVLPHVRSGGWMVAPAGGAPLSWHGTASEAEIAARRHAASRRAARIYLHDRYERVRGAVI